MPSPGYAKLTATDYAGLRRACLLGDTLIGPNTYAALVPSTVIDGVEDVRVSLHGHTIAVFAADGRVAIRDCGYVTQTTYGRLSQLVPAGWRIRRNKGQGVVSFGDDLRSPIFPGEWVILRPDGTLG